MRIMVLNQHGANYGDDAAGFAAMYHLKRKFPSAEFAIVYNYYEHTGGGPELPNLGDGVKHYAKLWPANRDYLKLAIGLLSGVRVDDYLSVEMRTLVNLVRTCDLVFISPCGANIGIYRDGDFLTRIMAATYAGAKPIFHLNTIGKSGTLIFDFLAKRVLKRSVLFVREWCSYELMGKMGLAAGVGPDTAFALPARPPAETVRDVVLVPTDVRRWFRNCAGFDMETFERELCQELTQFAAANGMAIRLIPHIHHQSDEAELLNRIAGRLRDERAKNVSVMIDEQYDTYEGYEDRIARASLVVSMRYHGVVLAAKNGVPFVSLAYENKMAEVAAYSGCTDCNLNLTDWDATAFRNMLKAVHDSTAEKRAVLTKTAKILARLAQLPSDYAWLETQRLQKTI